MKRILSLDASLCSTGWTVYESDGKKWSLIDSGVISTQSEAKKKKIYKGDDMTRRLREIIEGLLHLLETHDPKAVCCEMFVGSQNASAASALSSAKAIVVTLCMIQRRPLLEVTPDDVKIALYGDKTASKRQMKDAACKLYPELKEQYHVSKTSNDGYTGKFEHVADSVGVFKAVRNTPTIQLLEQM